MESPRAPADGGTVVKVGGALLGRQGALDNVIPVLAAAAARGAPILVVPGGGPFADTVRRVERESGLTADAAHWMAILAMNQYAELLASRIPRARIVEGANEIAPARASGLLPVLAPYRWLRSADPSRLPHSWEVTSDSIAAWVAGELGASRLVLVKASRADRAALVDGYFEQVLPPRLHVVIAEAGELGDVLGV